jgi:hypothetical protein
MGKNPKTIPGFVTLGDDAYVGVDQVKKYQERLVVLQLEMMQAKTHLQRAASLAAHWKINAEFERMLAEMIAEARTG